jgi:hypothetical protein
VDIDTELAKSASSSTDALHNENDGAGPSPTALKAAPSNIASSPEAGTSPPANIGQATITVPLQDFVNYIKLANSVDVTANEHKKMIQDLGYEILLGEWLIRLEELQMVRLRRECDIHMEKSIITKIVEMWEDRAEWDTDNAYNIRNWLSDSKQLRTMREQWRNLQILKDEKNPAHPDALAIFNKRLDKLENDRRKLNSKNTQRETHPTDESREPMSPT